jgi:bacillithiol biosynthesis cysteine-adding enzyme BshC
MQTIVDTPLVERPAVPAVRADRWNPALAGALLAGADQAVTRLSEPEALVVTTGQQPGLFTGPLYTVHKALSARGMALALERRWQRPVVPVFWVAGDDHDFTEAGATAWFAPDGGLVTRALDPRPVEASLRPMAAEPVSARVAELLEELATALPAAPARDATIGWLGRHYRSGATLAAAFGGAMAELVGPLGIACLDATASPAKQAGAAIVVEALRQSERLERLLVTRAAELEAAGVPPDVKVGDGATLGFLIGPAGRDRLVRDGAGFRTRRGGESVTIADLERIAREEPTRLSPNVLLRPVVESALMPTVAYAAGPGELRYLTLAEVLFEPLGVPRPLPVPRWSGIMVEPRVTRTLERLGIGIEELLAPGDQLETRIITSLAPPDFAPAFADLRAAVETGFDRLAGIAKAIDRTAEQPALGAKGATLGTLAQLEKRLLQAQKRRGSELLGQVERARNAVRPGGVPQERVIGFPALAGRYGIDLITALADHIAAWYERALEGDPTSA